MLVLEGHMAVLDTQVVAELGRAVELGTLVHTVVVVDLDSLQEEVVGSPEVVAVGNLEVAVGILEGVAAPCLGQGTSFQTFLGDIGKINDSPNDN